MGCHASVQAAPPAQGREGFSRSYTLSSTIGEGSFGQVHAAWSLKARRSRAVKVLDLVGDGSEPAEKLTRAARHELKVWSAVGRSEYCVELLESFVDESTCFLVMERCEASLMDKLYDISRCGDGERSRIFREMMYGVAHLHNVRIVHRDIKPNNFLLGGDNGRVVKLCDFGLSALAPKTGKLLKGCYGTAPYMAPEMVSESGHIFSADIWSYGATVYTMTYREFPYSPSCSSSKAMKMAVLSGTPAPRYARSGSRPVGEAVEAFIRALLVREVEERHSAQEALQLPFLSSQSLRVLSNNSRNRAATGQTLGRSSSRISNGSCAVATKGQGVSDESTQSSNGMPCSSTTSLESAAPPPTQTQPQPQSRRV